jgi:hypothetical protein
MRRVTSILAVLSLFLLFLTLIFWIRSLTVGDHLGWRSAPKQFDAYSIDGILEIAWGRAVSAHLPPEGWTGTFWPFKRNMDRINSNDMWKGTWAGFHFSEMHRHSPAASFDTTELNVPYWFSGLALIAFPLWRGITFVQKRRLQGRTLCSNCHYDLRVHVPGDNCPECGTPILSQSVKINTDETRRLP